MDIFENFLDVIASLFYFNSKKNIISGGCSRGGRGFADAHNFKIAEMCA